MLIATQTKLPKKIRNRRAKLIAALRSGKYKQTVGSLEDFNTRGKPYKIPRCCAMGVARRVWAEQRDRFDRETTLAGGKVSKDSVMDHAARAYVVVPAAIERYFGYEGQTHHIMNWNDAGNSFKRIADKLEAQIDSVVLEDQ